MAKADTNGHQLTDLTDVLGKTFIDKLDDPQPEHHPLRIGTQTWSRHRLVTDVGVMHMRVCKVLTQIADDLRCKNVREFYEKTNPYLFGREPGAGITTLYVAWRVTQ